MKQDNQIIVLPTKDQIASFILEYEKEPSHRNSEVMKQLAELVKSLPFLKKAQNQKGIGFLISTLNRMKLERLRKGDELYSKNDLNKNQFYILLSGQAIMRIEPNNKLILQARNTNSSLQQAKQSCLWSENSCIESSQNMLNIELRPKASSIIKQGDYLIKQRAKLLLPQKITKEVDKENMYLEAKTQDIKQEVGIEQRVISGLATIGESSHISRDGGYDVLGIEVKSSSAVVLRLTKDNFVELFSDIVQSEEICRKQSMFEQIPLFRQFNESELKAVMKKTNILSFKKGQAVFKETDKADRCFIVKKGEFAVEKEIKVTKNVLMPDIFKQNTSKRALICSFTQGQLFGLEEMFLSSENSLNSLEGIRMNSVRCLSQEGELFEIPYIALSQFLDNGRLDFELKNWKTKAEFRNDILSKQRQNIDAQQQNILSIKNALKSGEQHKQKQLLHNTQSQQKLQQDQTQTHPCNIQSYSSTIPQETFLTKLPEDYRSENYERCQQRQRSNTEFVFGSNKPFSMNSIKPTNNGQDKYLFRQPSTSLSSNTRQGNEIADKRRKWISQLSGNNNSNHRCLTSDQNQCKTNKPFSQPFAYLTHEATFKEQGDYPLQQFDKLNNLQIELNTNSTDSSGFGYIPDRISQRCPNGIKEASNSLEESQELKILHSKCFTLQHCGVRPSRKLEQMDTLQTITSDSLSYSMTKTRSLTMTSNQHSKFRDFSNNTTIFKITSQEENISKAPAARQSLLKLLQHNQQINTKYFSPDFSTLEEEEDLRSQNRKQQLKILPSLAVKNTKRLMKKSRRLSQDRLLQGLNNMSSLMRPREPSFQMKKIIQRQQLLKVA